MGTISLLLVGFIFFRVSAEPSPIPDPQPQPEAGISSPEQELLTRYLLSRILEKDHLKYPEDSRDKSDERVGQRRDDQDSSPSIVYPQVSQQSITQPLRRLLQKAKENIEVIDFRKPAVKPRGSEQIRKTRMPEGGYYTAVKEDGRTKQQKPRRGQKTAPSVAIPTFLPFPGTEPNRPLNRCSECVSEGGQPHSRFSMPLTQLGDKKYYLGIFFKANWYKAEQYCRFHGMHLASINSGDEQKNLEEHIQSFGMGHEHFWTSGTDQAEEGKFFWMSTGKPMTYENWNAGEPNNFQYENGEQEHCLELWNRDGKGLRWNDTPCSFETFFVCEV